MTTCFVKIYLTNVLLSHALKYLSNPDTSHILSLKFNLISHTSVTSPRLTLHTTYYILYTESHSTQQTYV